MGWHLMARHRRGWFPHHIQTSDERLLPGGTACLTDLG